MRCVVGAKPVGRGGRMERSVGRCSGFTLIELLVVLAVIALLIGILLPVLGRSREAGYNAQCLANLRGIFGGAVMYAHDYDGFLPSRDAVEPGVTGNVGAIRMRPGDFLPASDPNPGLGPEEWGLAALFERFGYMVPSPDSWVCQANTPFLDYGMTYGYATSISHETTRYEELGENTSSTVYAFDAFNQLPSLPGSLGPLAYGPRVPAIPAADQVPVHARGGTVSVIESTNAAYLDGHVAQRLD